MDPPGSPSYTQHLTPGRAAMVRDRSCAETWVPIGTVGSHTAAAALFLTGSLLIVASVNGSQWFLAGFIAYLVGTFAEFVEGCFSELGFKVARALNAAFHCVVAILLVVFHTDPAYFDVEIPLVFSVLMCVASVVDVVFVTKTHDDPMASGVQLGHLKSWAGVVAVARFLGALFFTAKYVYYELYFTGDIPFRKEFPRAFNVVASIFFVISGLARYPNMRAKLKASKKALAPKDADTADFE